MRQIVIWIICAMAFCSCGQDAALTLVPPGKVSDKVSLDIRAGVSNSLEKTADYKLAIYLDKISQENLLTEKIVCVPSSKSHDFSYRLSLDGLEGQHEIIFVAENNGRKSVVRRKTCVVNSETRSIGTIDGAWIGFYHWSEIEGKHWNGDIRKLTADDWRGILRSMHNAGMDIVVLQELFRNQEYVGQHKLTSDTYPGKAFYPSELYPGRMDIACKDPVDVIMKEAEKLGMNVFVGVGLFAWFDFSAESLEWHKRVSKELWERYGKYDSFYGFYVSEECVGSLDNCEATEELRSLRKDEIVAFFKEYKRFCNEMAPSKPIMLATNSMGVTEAENTYSELLEYLDILCPFGFARMPEGDIAGYEAAHLLQEWCDRSGAHLWFDLEAFLFNPDMSLYPRDFDGIRRDLLMFDNFEKILCYQYPGVFNNPALHSLVGDPRSVQLYQDYLEYRQSK